MFGPTGGYLIGFIPMAVIAGIFIEKSGRKLVLGMIGMILGTAVCYIFGTVWFVLVMKTSVQAALTMCVYPFIVFDIIKMVLAAWIGGRFTDVWCRRDFYKIITFYRIFREKGPEYPFFYL